TAAHLAPGSVSSEQLQAGAVTAVQIADGAAGTLQLADGSVTREKLAEGIAADLARAVHAADVLQSHAFVESDRIVPGAVQGRHLADGAIGTRQLAGEAIDERHIRDYTLPISKLSFNPVVSTVSEGIVQQQFGLVPFTFSGLEEQIEAAITFDEAYVDDRYVLTITTDQPTCFASIKMKTPEFAVVTVSRLRIGPVPSGTLNWIAIGSRS